MKTPEFEGNVHHIGAYLGRPEDAPEHGGDATVLEFPTSTADTTEVNPHAFGGMHILAVLRQRLRGRDDSEPVGDMAAITRSETIRTYARTLGIAPHPENDGATLLQIERLYPGSTALFTGTTERLRTHALEPGQGDLDGAS